MTSGSVDPASYGARRPRSTCHRCGWTDSLRKVGRRQRTVLGADRHVRFLCDECVSDLCAAAEAPRPAEQVSSTGPPPRRDSYRSVA